METTEPNPIANYQAYYGTKSRPMTMDESKFFITLEFTPYERLNAEFLDHKSLKENLAFQILKGRLAEVGVTPEPKLLIWLTTLCKTPGDAVLWAFTVARRTVDLAHAYTFIDWIMDFPLGPPTDQERKRVWDEQKGFHLKGKFDNAVDSMNWWPRIPVAI